MDGDTCGFGLWVEFCSARLFRALCAKRFIGQVRGGFRRCLDQSDERRSFRRVNQSLKRKIGRLFGLFFISVVMVKSIRRMISWGYSMTRPRDFPMAQNTLAKYTKSTATISIHKCATNIPIPITTATIAKLTSLRGTRMDFGENVLICEIIKNPTNPNHRATSIGYSVISIVSDIYKNTGNSPNIAPAGAGTPVK